MNFHGVYKFILSLAILLLKISAFNYNRRWKTMQMNFVDYLYRWSKIITQTRLSEKIFYKDARLIVFLPSPYYLLINLTWDDGQSKDAGERGMESGNSSVHASWIAG